MSFIRASYRAMLSTVRCRDSDVCCRYKYAASQTANGIGPPGRTWGRLISRLPARRRRRRISCAASPRCTRSGTGGYGSVHAVHQNRTGLDDRLLGRGDGAQSPDLGRPAETEAARKVLEKITDTPQLSPRERAYLQAVRVLYGEGDKPARDKAYAAAMEKIYRDTRMMRRRRSSTRSR